MQVTEGNAEKHEKFASGNKSFMQFPTMDLDSFSNQSAHGKYTLRSNWLNGPYT